MNFKIVGLFLVLLVFTACEEKKEAIEFENGQNFAITGNVIGAEGEKFYLEALSAQGNIKVDQAVADDKGNFKIVGNIPGFGLYQLKIGEGNAKIIPLTLVPNDQVTIESDTASYVKTPKLTGTAWAPVMTSYMEKFSKFHEEQGELMKLQGTISDEELTERYMALKGDVDTYAINQMKKDPSNPFNLILTSSASPNMGFAEWDPANLEVLKSVTTAYQKDYSESPITATLVQQTAQIDAAYQQHVANNSGSRMAPEIGLNTPEGNQLLLSSLRGKYVLIDFWASWCGPCRKESPALVRLFNKYKNDGFTIYSVSLDKNKEKWVDAISKDGLEWPNHVSDLLQWKSPMIQLYGFNSIPYTVLVDTDGKIIATGLRGQSLEQKLKEIFKK